MSRFAFRGQDRSLASYKQDSDGRWWRTMPIQATGAQDSWFAITDPMTGKSYHGNWAFSEQRIKEMVDAGKIRFPKNDDGKPVQVVYADEMANDRSPIFANLGRYDSETATKQLISLMNGKIFDFPKPLDLIKFLVGQVAADGDVILDFFSGSSTTAHAVMALNAEDGQKRQHIQVQLPEPVDEKSESFKAGYRTISEMSRKRIGLAGAKVIAELEKQIGNSAGTQDVGFRAYKLSDTNFSKWKASSDVDEDALQQRLLGLRESASDDASADELLTEILLKQGFGLTEQIKPRTVGALEARAVYQADGDLAVLAYLDERVKPSLEQLRVLVDEKPGKVIVLEDAFQGDDELKTNLAQLCKTNGIELWTA